MGTDEGCGLIFALILACFFPPFFILIGIIFVFYYLCVAFKWLTLKIVAYFHDRMK